MQLTNSNSASCLLRCMIVFIVINSIFCGRNAINYSSNSGDEKGAINGVPQSIGGYNVYFGDFHNHSNVSDGRGTPAEAYRYAKEEAELDFFSLSDHCYLINKSEWATIKMAADSYNENGVFTTLWGFEWSSNGKYGHVSVLNTDDYCTATAEATDSFQELCDWLEPNNGIAFFNHPGREDAAECEFEHFIGTVSDRVVGIELFNKSNGFDTYYYNDGYVSGDNSGYYDEANSAGWKVGAAGAGDNHWGTWGTATDYRIAVLSHELTRTALVEALHARRFYSTLDLNIALSFKIDNTEMGATIEGGSHELEVEATDGDNEMFTKVQLINKNKVAIKTWNPNSQNVGLTENINVFDGNYYYVKVTQEDGDEAISSPLWVRGGNANVSPKCTITSPKNGALFTSNETITITADASDEDGTIVNVLFYVDGKLIGETGNSTGVFKWENRAIGNYALTAVAVDNGGQSTISSEVNISVTPIQVNSDPQAHIASDLISGEAPLTVTFDATGSTDPDGDALTCHWDFGDGTESKKFEVSHIYSESGSYEVELTVTDSDGAAGTATATVTVSDVENQNPVAKVAVRAKDTESPFTRIFDGSESSDTDGDTVQYVWSFDDGSISTEKVVEHTFGKDGVFEVTLRVSDGKGGSSLKTVTIEITGQAENKAPTCFIIEPILKARYTAPADVEVVVDAQDGDGTVEKVEFFLQGDKIDEDSEAPYETSISELAAGRYTVKVTVTDDDGAVTERITKVRVE